MCGIGNPHKLYTIQNHLSEKNDNSTFTYPFGLPLFTPVWCSGSLAAIEPLNAASTED